MKKASMLNKAVPKNCAQKLCHCLFSPVINLKSLGRGDARLAAAPPILQQSPTGDRKWVKVESSLTFGAPGRWWC